MCLGQSPTRLDPKIEQNPNDISRIDILPQISSWGLSLAPATFCQVPWMETDDQAKIHNNNAHATQATHKAPQPKIVAPNLSPESPVGMHIDPILQLVWPFWNNSFKRTRTHRFSHQAIPLLVLTNLRGETTSDWQIDIIWFCYQITTKSNAVPDCMDGESEYLWIPQGVEFLSESSFPKVIFASFVPYRLTPATGWHHIMQFIRYNSPVLLAG